MRLKLIKMLRFHGILALSVLTAVWASGCGGGGSSDDEEDSGGAGETVVVTASSGPAVSPGTDSDGAVETNPIALAYPLGLSLAVFPKDSLGVKSAAAKHQDALTRLKGEAADCKPPILSSPPSVPAPTCLSGEGSLLYATNPVTVGTQDGSDGQGEGCLFATARHMTLPNVLLVDKSLGLVEALFCQAMKSGKNQLLNETATRNLKDELTSTLAGVATVTSADISRLNDSNGRPRFLANLVLTEADASKLEIHLLHVPAAMDDADAYEGRLWVRHQMQTETAKSQPLDPHLSLSYSKQKGDGNPVIAGHLIAAKMIPVIGDQAFNSDGHLNINAGADTKGSYINPATGKAYAQASEAVADILSFEFNQRLADGHGRMGIWWDHNPEYLTPGQGMIFDVKVENSQVSSCGLLGTTTNSAADALSVRRALIEGKPLDVKGFYHPHLQTEDLSGCYLNSDALEADSKGSFYQRICGGTTYKWYQPSGLGSAGDTFFTKKWGGLALRQCVTKTNDQFVLDSAKIPAAAGYELIDAANPGDKKIERPDLGSLADHSASGS